MMIMVMILIAFDCSDDDGEVCFFCANARSDISHHNLLLQIMLMLLCSSDVSSSLIIRITAIVFMFVLFFFLNRVGRNVFLTLLGSAFWGMHSQRQHAPTGSGHYIRFDFMASSDEILEKWWAPCQLPGELCGGFMLVYHAWPNPLGCWPHLNIMFVLC